MEAANGDVDAERLTELAKQLGQAAALRRLGSKSLEVDGLAGRLQPLRRHPEVLHPYVGEWVVVEGESVLVHGRDPVRLVAEARRLGVRSPYVFFVESSQPDVVRLGL